MDHVNIEINEGDASPSVSNNDTSIQLGAHSNVSLNDTGSDAGMIKSRKRTRNPKSHKEYNRKLSVQKGKEHESRTGRTIRKKVFKVQSKCECNRKCCQSIDLERQREIFNVYYDFENWGRKRLFLRSLATSHPSKEDIDKIAFITKNFRHQYHFVDKNGSTYQVCQKFLLQCLQISKSTLYRALRSTTSNENAVEHRGLFPNKKSDPNDSKFLHDFIKRFPCHKSHYSSSNSNVKYLNPSLNIVRMYREYCLVCQFYRRKELSLWIFSHIFNTKFNLRFHRRKIDTCKKCDKLDSLIKSKTGDDQLVLELEKQEHLKIVKKYKIQFSETVEDAKTQNNKTEVRTFDLQRALEIPYISTSEAYYKRQLWVYNLCIYDEVRRRAYMYVWPESMASRGSEEIASCLFRHFYETVPEETESIILYSDSCSGQNRNIAMSMMLKYVLDSWSHNNLKKIEQRFFVVGHSYNSCDRSFALIEKQKRITEEIFVPIHWINLIGRAKKKDPKFVVNEMQTENFLSWKKLLSLIINRKRSTEGNRISWFSFQTIIYNRNVPFILEVQEYNSGLSPIINISLQKRHVHSLHKDLSVLYPNGRKIAEKKFNDLKELMQYIPTKYHSFFEGLKFKSLNNDSDDEN